jgi:hypothetical protein
MSRSITQEPIGQEPDADFLAQRSEQPQFTIRALVLGLLIGVLIAFSNTYFGLQTGWISGMAMPSALIGFAYFKGLRALMCRLGDTFQRLGWGEGFTEVENVLVQTVAGSVGTMPLGCGFVGVVPALEFLLKPEETPESTSTDPDIIYALSIAEQDGGLQLPLGKLILWALGLCFFGVVFAVPLRKEVIVREKLKFPSGTATALMIGVLHGGEKTGAEGNIEEQHSRHQKQRSSLDDEEEQRLMGDTSPEQNVGLHNDEETRRCNEPSTRDWKKQIRLLMYSFCVSGFYVRKSCPSDCVCAGLCADSRFVDSAILFHPSAAQSSNPRNSHVERMALESESKSGLCWSRHYNGPGNYDPYVLRRRSRLGHSITSSQVQRMGFRGCGRLEYWIKGLDRVGESGNHACGCNHQLRLAHLKTHHLV